MIYNSSMEPLLQAADMTCAMPDKYPIRRRTTPNGMPYWAAGNFCGLDVDTDKQGETLCWAEWDGNGTYLSEGGSVLELLAQGLCVLKDWKRTLAELASGVSFDLLLSVDLAEDPEVRAMGVTPSVTLRFWAVRDGFHCVEPAEDELERFDQPVLIDVVRPS